MSLRLPRQTIRNENRAWSRQSATLPRNYGDGASSRKPLRNGVMLGRCSACRNDTEVVTFGDREMDWARGAGDDLRIKASSRSSLSRPSYFSVQIQWTQALGGVDQTRQAMDALVKGFAKAVRRWRRVTKTAMIAFEERIVVTRPKAGEICRGNIEVFGACFPDGIQDRLIDRRAKTQDARGQSRRREGSVEDNCLMP